MYSPTHITRWPSRSAETAACILEAFNRRLPESAIQSQLPECCLADPGWAEDLSYFAACVSA